MLVRQGRKQYEVLMADASMDIHQRKAEIMSMADRVLSQPVPLSLVTQPDMKLSMPPKAISSFLEALTIDNCDRPSAPVLIVDKVTFDAMTVETPSCTRDDRV